MADRKKRERKLNILSDKSSFGYVEAFKALRTNISYLMNNENRGRVLMITSSIPGQGKSTGSSDR